VVIFRKRGPWRRYPLFQVLQLAPRIMLLCWSNNPDVIGDSASYGATQSCYYLFWKFIPSYRWCWHLYQTKGHEGCQDREKGAILFYEKWKRVTVDIEMAFWSLLTWCFEREGDTHQIFGERLVMAMCLFHLFFHFFPFSALILLQHRIYDYEFNVEVQASELLLFECHIWTFTLWACNGL
jgi:hypothetical protein